MCFQVRQFIVAKHSIPTIRRRRYNITAAEIIKICLSLQVATGKDNGILLYKEDHDPLALELYQGHIRLIYDIANYPPTTVYR